MYYIIVELWTMDGVCHHPGDLSKLKWDKNNLGNYNGVLLGRLDGPAVVWRNGDYAYFIDGKEISNMQEFQEETCMLDEDITALILKYGEF